ncbi:MAG: 30S ribosomal protein S4 [Planctomycetes bacterium]|jgi:small subunit ribosomal protein S4|nr:30S ribosomal protein S4 [Planctomycetota bacterium]MCL4729230.1 30S ribosomal protein S4 [Planctomycetota bacterium]
MGRYTGAKHRVSRRFTENIWGTKKSPLATRPYKPGQHGKDGKKTKTSTYGAGLLEKQKVKLFYQLRERSFRRYYREALRLPGNTGETLMQMLERRLDNIVYRLGFAPTNRAARQLVSHGHVRVNGRKVDRASYLVEVGDKITLRDKSKAHLQVQEAVSAKPQVVSYLKADHDKLEGELIQIPRRKDIPIVANERLIIEFLGR